MSMGGIKIIVCTGYFSHCCYQIIDKKYIKGGRVYFSLLCESTVRHDRDDITTGAWLYVLTFWQTRKLESWDTIFLLAFSFPPSYGMVLPTFRASVPCFCSLPLEMNLWICPNVFFTDALEIFSINLSWQWRFTNALCWMKHPGTERKVSYDLTHLQNKNMMNW